MSIRVCLYLSQLSLGTAAHELGHAFGLDHDFRDLDNVMSYGSEDRISACAAAFLSVHPYFNDDIPLEEESLPTFEVISSDRYPSGATGLSARIKVSDAEGIHQVKLQDAVGFAGSILTCRVLSGEKDAVVEFTYDFLEIPGWVREALLQRVVHQFSVEVTDIHGNDMNRSFTYVEVSKHQIAVLEGHGRPVWSVVFSPDGSTLAAARRGTIVLLDAAPREEVATLEGHSDDVVSVAFSPDGTTLASGSDDGTAKLWDVASHEAIATLMVRYGAALSGRLRFRRMGPPWLPRRGSGSRSGTWRPWKRSAIRNRTVQASLLWCSRPMVPHWLPAHWTARL